jgi:hypothetical protein
MQKYVTYLRLGRVKDFWLFGGLKHFLARQSFSSEHELHFAISRTFFKNVGFRLLNL